MPMAWCSLEMSRLAGIHVTVTWPQEPLGVEGGRMMR
jgi:hypothetical protein